VRSSRHPTPPSRSAHLQWGLAIFLAALALRVVYLWQMKDADPFSVLIGDGASYQAWAEEIARGNWLGSDVFYQAPLYPYFLATIYSVVGPDPFAARLVQILLGSAACWLLLEAGRLFFSPPAGIVAGALLAFYPTALFFDGLIQKSALDLTFTSALLYCLGRQLSAPRGAYWSVIGVILGCLALTRENALVLLPVLVGWQALYFRQVPVRERAVWAAWLVLGAGLVLVPVGVRNTVVGGEFHLTTAQLGANFYIGNGPSATGRYVALRAGHGNAALERAEATELAEQAIGRRLKPREVSCYWMEQGLAWIGAHPGDWLRLMGKKWMLVWNAEEVTDTEDQATYGDYSVVLRLLSAIFHFGVLAPLAALGVYLTWQARARLAILYVMTIVLALSVAAFYVVGRYRFPLVPVLVLFAGAGIWEGVEALRRRNWRCLSAAAAVAVAAAVAANWPLITPGSQRAPTRYNLGVELAARGDLGSARGHFLAAVALDPHLGAAWGNLGIIHGMDGNLVDAERCFREALRQEPGLTEHRANLGAVLAAQGRHDEALAQYREAVRQQPRFVDARKRLGLALLESGSPAEATTHLEEAVRMAPADPQARYGLGIALAGQGRQREAVATLGEARTLAAQARDEALLAEITQRLATVADHP
jgi:Tfp pilus assembly protein PilF